MCRHDTGSFLSHSERDRKTETFIEQIKMAYSLYTLDGFEKEADQLVEEIMGRAETIDLGSLNRMKIFNGAYEYFKETTGRNATAGPNTNDLAGRALMRGLALVRDGVPAAVADVPVPDDTNFEEVTDEDTDTGSDNDYISNSAWSS